jgi:methyltransferase (TIGR00027 family)
MQEQLTIADVSDTSFWVAYYRAKESERQDALFRDPFAKALVGERGKKIADSMANISRYTEWSVVSRTVIIDRFIEKAIADGVDAVINLGAGLDARPYRMNLPEDFEWIEADYLNIITHKNFILKSEVPKCRLTRTAVDLANDQSRREFLSQAAPTAKKALILTEGVIPYLSPEQVTALSKDMIEQKRFAYWITEYFHPRVYRYLKATVRQGKMKNAPFLFYPDDWYGFFRARGWNEKETRFSGEIAVEFKRKPPMPKWAQFLMFAMPKRVKEESLRMSGYVTFQRGQP